MLSLIDSLLSVDLKNKSYFNSKNGFIRDTSNSKAIGKSNKAEETKEELGRGYFEQKSTGRKSSGSFSLAELLRKSISCRCSVHLFCWGRLLIILSCWGFCWRGRWLMENWHGVVLCQCYPFWLPDSIFVRSPFIFTIYSHMDGKNTPTIHCPLRYKWINIACGLPLNLAFPFASKK